MIARLFIFIVLFSIVWLIVKLILGFWYDARGETCDWCKGSGRLPRQ